MEVAGSEPDRAPALPPVVRAMLDPAFYPGGPRNVRLVQTHISYVFLAGAEVFKIKKPVRFSFLDFSTLERRRHFCGDEVRLNRSLTTDVYLGVVAICPDGAGFRIGEEGDPDAVEYAVRMKRLPADRMFSEILARGEAADRHVQAIARRLVDFHAGADGGPEVAANGSPEALLAVLANDFSESHRYRGRTISDDDDRAIQDFLSDFVATRASFLRCRQEGGHIREGHGDLRAEHICFADELQIIDCVEFDARFRRRDVAAEVAFLAMDIEHLGHPALARSLVERYAQDSSDPDLAWLVPFYQCYFAYIRGKVDSLTGAEVEVGEADRAHAEQSARRHFAQAYRYTWTYSPMLIVVGGLSGSGKTTIARALRERVGFGHVNSDIVRKELTGHATDRPAPAEAKPFLYAAEQSRRTYERMHDLAREELARGRGVIVDATFQRRVDRAAIRELAYARKVPILFVECRCDEEEIRRRLDRRVRSGTGASDADWDVYRAQVANYESFPLSEADTHVVVRSTDPLPAILAQIEAAARRRLSKNMNLPSANQPARGGS